MARRAALSVHLIAAVSAELACEAHPDCASCTSDPPCGWCSGRHFRLENETMVKVETAHCTEGTANGPITQFCENFQFSACATPETDVVRPCEGALPRAPTPIHSKYCTPPSHALAPVAQATSLAASASPMSCVAGARTPRRARRRVGGAPSTTLSSAPARLTALDTPVPSTACATITAATARMIAHAGMATETAPTPARAARGTRSRVTARMPRGRGRALAPECGVARDCSTSWGCSCRCSRSSRPTNGSARSGRRPIPGTERHDATIGRCTVSTVWVRARRCAEVQCACIWYVRRWIAAVISGHRTLHSARDDEKIHTVFFCPDTADRPD